MSGYWSPMRDEALRYWQRATEQREAEERGRLEWITDVKRRLGIVTIGERVLPYRLEWPVDFADGSWRVVSDNRLEIPLDWPPECRCVLLNGEQVSLGGPCPVHQAA